MTSPIEPSADLRQMASATSQIYIALTNEDEECAADRMDTTYLPRERADEIAVNLAAAVHRAEREARE